MIEEQKALKEGANNELEDKLNSKNDEIIRLQDEVQKVREETVADMEKNKEEQKE